jgi:hypothetical protein
MSSDSERRFDLRQLPAGMYQLRIIGENGPVFRKISIEK